MEDTYQVLWGKQKSQMYLLIFSKTTFVKIMPRLFFQENFPLSSFLESSQHAEEQDVPGVPQKHLKLMHSIIYVIMQMVKISSQSAHTSLRL